MLYRLLTALYVLVMLPAAAQAAGGVALSSKVFLEKTIVDADGKARVVLREPTVVTPGDTLVFMLGYHNQGSAPASNFVVTNPVPSAIAFRGAGDGSAEVSVDGGRSWGALATLRVRDPDDRLRAARPEDVTHVRWAISRAVAAGAQGRVSFRGVVR